MKIANSLFFEQVEAEIAAGRRVEIRVHGYSMQPLLRNERDRVVLAPADAERLAVGTIVLFRYRGRHILHRIVRREGDRFTLAGDGNYATTEHCTSRDIVAVAQAVVRCSGRVVSCRSLRWRLLSHSWLAMPDGVRKFARRVLSKLGYR